MNEKRNGPSGHKAIVSFDPASGHERASIKKQIYYVLQKYRLGKQAPALRNKKDNFYFYFLHTFDRKSISKPVLKIFAFTDCGYAFFLLSANIYQATFSVRKGLFLKSLKPN